jgi:hypothetical protein
MATTWRQQLFDRDDVNAMGGASPKHHCSVELPSAGRWVSYFGKPVDLSPHGGGRSRGSEKRRRTEWRRIPGRDASQRGRVIGLIS